jgi:hypothetical protein
MMPDAARRKQQRGTRSVFSGRASDAPRLRQYQREVAAHGESERAMLDRIEGVWDNARPYRGGAAQDYSPRVRFDGPSAD